MGLLICGLELLVQGQHVVVLLHHAGGLDMGGGLDGFRTGQIARGGERDSAGQHRTGDYGKWPTADASRPHGDHAARVSAELTLHQVDVMIVGGLGKHGIDKGLALAAISMVTVGFPPLCSVGYSVGCSDRIGCSGLTYRTAWMSRWMTSQRNRKYRICRTRYRSQAHRPF